MLLQIFDSKPGKTLERGVVRVVHFLNGFASVKFLLQYKVDLLDVESRSHGLNDFNCSTLATKPL